MLRLIGETKFDFIGKRRIFYAVSVIVIAAGLFTYFKKAKTLTASICRRPATGIQF
jgi:preprotein translocase subunit SecF